jgi:hypothetical protein
MPDGEHSLNRHGRRRRAVRQRRATIRDFHDQAAGVFAIQVVTPPALLALCLNSLGLARSLAQWITEIEHSRPLCIACDTVFTAALAPTMWLLARPANDGTSVAMLMGACSECVERHPSSEALTAAAAEALKRGAWPDLRVLDPARFAAGSRA